MIEADEVDRIGLVDMRSVAAVAAVFAREILVWVRRDMAIEARDRRFRGLTSAHALGVNPAREGQGS